MSRPAASTQHPHPPQPTEPAAAGEAEPKGMPTSDRYQAETAHTAEHEPPPGKRPAKDE